MSKVGDMLDSLRPARDENGSPVLQSEYDHLAKQLAERKKQLVMLRDAANALLHQIDIGDFVDSNGHSAKMLKATHDLMGLMILRDERDAIDDPSERRRLK